MLTCMYVFIVVMVFGEHVPELLFELPAQRTCLFSLVASDSVSEQFPSQQGTVPSQPPCHTHAHRHTEPT